MVLVLKESDFVNNKFTTVFGTDKIVEFTIVDEVLSETPSGADLGRINRIVIFVRNIDGTGGVLQSGVVGLGNMVVGVRSSNPAIRGALLSKENMEDCEVLLYNEDGTY